MKIFRIASFVCDRFWTLDFNITEIASFVGVRLAASQPQVHFKVKAQGTVQRFECTSEKTKERVGVSVFELYATFLCKDQLHKF